MGSKAEELMTYMLQSQREMLEAVEAHKGEDYKKLVHKTVNSYSAISWSIKGQPKAVRQPFVHAAACVLTCGAMELQNLNGHELTQEEVDEFMGYVKAISAKQVQVMWDQPADGKS